MKSRNDIVYSLNIEDVQSVAVQEMGRELTDEEIEKVTDLMGERINWYDAILNSLVEGII
jgi:hypothetical protein